MSLPDSRYSLSGKFITPLNDGTSFDGLRGRRITRLRGVIEYTIKPGDRLDLLAIHFYNDPAAWWYILDANPHIECNGIFSLEEFAGQKIVIPSTDSRMQAGRG